MRIETSWDDGCIQDLKMAEMLRKYKLPGTFYICSVRCPGTIQLSLKEVKKIYDLGFEVGGHTVTHPQDIKAIESDEVLEYEILNNKNLLEYLIVKNWITKFCYPRGRHDERVRKMVAKVGYKEARTTIILKTDLPTDPLQSWTTIHAHPTREEYQGRPWLEVAKEKFAEAKAKGDRGYFHLWGHSWELDKYNQWAEVEEMFKIMSAELSTV